MNRTATRMAPPVSRSMVLEDIDWRTYSRLLRAFAERPRIRLTYDYGRLEIMAPMLAHDDDSDFFGDLVKALAKGFGRPLKRGGSVTIRLRKAERGIEPDRCFWIANADRMAGVRRLDLRRHPPPDLAIEIDVAHSSLDRMGIYATLRVPELWRLEGNKLTFYILGTNRIYHPSQTSLSFPKIRPADLVPYLREARQAGDETPILDRFMARVRERAEQEG